MLTKFIVAGLIPGMMAKPIVPRQGANVERKGLGNRDLYSVKPIIASEVAISTLPSLGPSTIPSVSPSVPAVPTRIPTRIPTTIPTISSSLPVIQQVVPNVSISSFPVAPPPRIQSVMPAGQYAVAAPHAYPTAVAPAAIEIHDTPESTPVVPIVVPSLAPSYPVKNEYMVNSPPFDSHSIPSIVPISQALSTTVPVSHVFTPPAQTSHALPLETPSVPAEHQYAVAEPPFHSHPVAPTASSAAVDHAEGPTLHAPPVEAIQSQAVPSVTPPFSTYHVKEAPVHAPPVEAVQSHAAPSVTPTASTYSVEDAPAHAPAVEAIQSHTVPSVAPPASTYSVEDAPVNAPAAAAIAAPPHVYAVETPVIDHAVPVITPDPVGPSGKNECVTKCHPKCQRGDSQCMAACLQTCHSAKMLGSNGLAGSAAGKLLNNDAGTKDDGIPTANAKVAKAAGKPANDAPAFAAGAGFVSFEACMSSCKGKTQTADIAFTISQGKYNCAEACAEYASDGSSVTAKREVVTERAVEPVAGALRPAEPEFTTEAGFASFEACMTACNGRWQSANIVFDISQGRKNCKKACAQYAKDGSGVTVAREVAAAKPVAAKRAVEPVLGALRPAAPELTAGAGYVSFEACMKDCHGRWQSANIVFDISQGKKDCKTACASYDADRSGVVVKKNTAARSNDDATAPVKKTARAFPFEGDGPFNQPAKDGPFTQKAETVAGASTGNYEACMHGCGAKLQSADIAFEVEQGDANCATKCAQYSTNGANVSHL
ncbi:hypothetical protein F4803DRAFT_577362 [Xylaria telfairii]|nr:hypothetical protein F4803DRAFT_577362 [Xylaria telfairii]